MSGEKDSRKNKSKDISVNSSPAKDTEENAENAEGQADGSGVREELSHLKTKTIPAIVMLLGGLATSILCFVRQYSVLWTLQLVFLSLVVFLIFGGIVKLVLDRITLKKIIIVDVPEDEEEAEENGEEMEEGEEVNTDGESGDF